MVARGGEVGKTSGADPQSSCEGFYSKGTGKALESSEQRVTRSDLRVHVRCIWLAQKSM